MKLAPSVLKAKIYHKRLFPKENKFSYRLMYLALPLSKLNTLSIRPFFGANRAGIMSVWNRDHGDRKNRDLRDWVNQVLAENGVTELGGEIVLVTLPRLFGYVFNPVSFWLCHKPNGELYTVIAEVNNTFGESHNYVCVARDDGTIQPTDRFYADKEFHVSPFLDRAGHYCFKFDTLRDDFIGIGIDYFDHENRLQLQTSIAANFCPMTMSNLLRGWISSPLMSLKAISLIHWQAIKLLFKSAEYRPKPEQHRWYHTCAAGHAFDLASQQDKLKSEAKHSCT